MSSNKIINPNDNDILLGRGGKLSVLRVACLYAVLSSTSIPCIISCLLYHLFLGNNNKHIGNEKLRKVARTQADLYKTASKKEKSDISRSLVRHIRNLDPPGRFLKRDPTNRCWHDVGDVAAREKASQALRDALGEIDRPHCDDTLPPPNPIQKDPRPLKVPSLPNSYRCSYDYDNDYKRSNMPFEEGLVDH